MKRRSFLQQSAAITALMAAMSPLTLAQRALAALAPVRKRLSWLSYRTVTSEGAFSPSQVEGRIPQELSGSLFRIGPGAKENHGIALRHFFDGDAYVTKLKFENGRVEGLSRFVETVERKQEASSGKMEYLEFGTYPQGKPKGYKNSPNIHIHKIGEKLLACSESAAPIWLDAETLGTKGAWNFQGTLPSMHTFTAHSRLDAETGDHFTFGTTQGLSPALNVYRVEKNSGKLKKLHSLSLGGFYLVHDMILTKNYLIVAVPPVYVSLFGAAMQNTTIADLLKTEARKPLRIFVMKKDGSGTPLEFTSLPAGMIFHHCNAYEEEGKIILDSVMMEDDSVFKMFQNWGAETLPPVPPSKITRFELDLSARKILSRKVISDGTPTDFPMVDPRGLGNRLSYYYALEGEQGTEDPLHLSTLVCWKVDGMLPTRVKFPSTQMLGEPVFVPHPGSSPTEEEKAWILHMGYDSDRDETFLDIRKAVTLELEARVWLGRYIPLGFHGNFV